MKTRDLALATLILALAACSKDPAGLPADATITVQDFNFFPDSTTVKVGSVVEWMNAGPSTHTVTSDSSAWASQTLAPPGGGNPYGGTSSGGSFRFTFNKAGTYPFHCSIHTYMHGVVVVTP